MKGRPKTALVIIGALEWALVARACTRLGARRARGGDSFGAL